MSKQILANGKQDYLRNSFYTVECCFNVVQVIEIIRNFKLISFTRRGAGKSYYISIY